MFLQQVPHGAQPGGGPAAAPLGNYTPPPLTLHTENLLILLIFLLLLLLLCRLLLFLAILLPLILVLLLLFFTVQQSCSLKDENILVAVLKYHRSDHMTHESFRSDLSLGEIIKVVPVCLADLTASQGSSQESSALGQTLTRGLD